MPDLPTIRFLPDGSVGEGSPQMLRLTSSDGGSLWLAARVARAMKSVSTK